MMEDFKRRFWISLVLTLPILALSPMISGWLGYDPSFAGRPWVLLGLAVAVYAYGGWPFLKGLVDELRGRQPGMMTLIGLAISVAFGYSAAVVLGLPGRLFFWELATLVVIMLAGHWVEMRSVIGASKALESLAELMPSEARRITDDGSTEDVPVSELETGDRILIRPGEKVPADGTVVEGSSELDRSALTGESKPVPTGEGDDVLAGAVNGSGALTVAVGATGEDSYLNQVSDMVRRAQQSKSRTQNLADRAAFWLTVVALSAGTVTAVAWAIAGRELVFVLERTITVMVITCPHALGLAIPLVVAVSTAMSAKNGLLIRQRSPFERSRNLDAVVFDKTGTLTEGRFEVSDVIALGDADTARILALAAAVERQSEHPIAEGIVAKAKEDGVDVPSASGFEALSGRGARAEVDGAEVRVLSPGGLDDEGLSTDDDEVARARDEGKTVVFVVGGGELLGALALDDVVRDVSKEAVQMLHDRGLEVWMLTGDADAVASRVASELGIDRFEAEVLPDAKADTIEKIRSEAGTVAMVGDGVNDAPALATADVGIAIGAGTDVAVEAADIVLVRNDPRDVVSLIDFADATYRKMVQNLWWAAGYNIVAIPLAAGALAWAGVLLSPAVGAVLMSLSTVIVAVNARLLRVEPAAG
jgi:Cu2+-exporting ATPase